MIAFIVGSGFYDHPQLTAQQITTKWGSAEVLTGTINGREVALIPRHGQNHQLLPHHINYRANIAALKKLNASAIVSFSVVGALKPTIQLGQAYIINDLYFPENRLPNGDACTIFDTPGSKDRGHLIAGTLFNSQLIAAIQQILPAAKPANYVHSLGPRFNTKMEIANFQQLGGDVISQTCGPEAILANEHQIPFAICAFAIDYANGVVGNSTSIEELNQNLAASGKTFNQVIDHLPFQEYNFENFVYTFE